MTMFSVSINMYFKPEEGRRMNQPKCCAMNNNRKKDVKCSTNCFYDFYNLSIIEIGSKKTIVTSI